MKELKKLLIVLGCLVIFANLYSNEYELKNVPKDFTGTYIPTHMEYLLKQYMSYEKALDAVAEAHYDILLLKDDICYSNLRFHDGYAVETKDFEKWSFIEKGKERFILDEKGLSYRRISDSWDGSVFGYSAYAQDIGSIICHDLLQNKNVSINGYELKIFDKKYLIELESTYSSEESTLILREIKGNSGALCFLQKEGLSAKIYNAVPGEYKMMWDRGTEVLQSIPLFYWNDEEYLFISAYKYENSKEDLRLLRNLIFAKHGYVFKDKELQQLFEQFEWYKPNSNFSEKDFSNREQNLLNDILRLEKN